MNLAQDKAYEDACRIFDSRLNALSLALNMNPGFFKRRKLLKIGRTLLHAWKYVMNQWEMDEEVN
jgi:hypothetical protein